MLNTPKRVHNPESLVALGKQLRKRREELGLAQSKVRGIRQATISKIERGGDVTVDTLVSYANALGMELTFVAVGQTAFVRRGPRPPARALDLLEEFSDLKDGTP